MSCVGIATQQRLLIAGDVNCVACISDSLENEFLNFFKDFFLLRQKQ